MDFLEFFFKWFDIVTLETEKKEFDTMILCPLKNMFMLKPPEDFSIK